MLKALAETVLPRRSGLPEPEEAAAGALAFVAGLPPLHRAALRAGLLLLEVSPPFLVGRLRRFSALAPPLRERCLRRALDGAGPLRPLASILRPAIRSWKALLLVLLYDDPRARARIGYDIAGHVRGVYARDAEATAPSGSARAAAERDLSGDSAAGGPPPGLLEAGAIGRSRRDLSCDVAVVGSGAGGGVVAARLAAAGWDVVVLEEGPHPDAVGLVPGLVPTLSRLYRDGGATVIHGRPPILFQEGRCVGGSTVVNGGMAWRTPESVMRLWRERHGLGFMTPDGMEPHFRWVEKISGVTLQDPVTLSPGERLFLDAAVSLGMHPRPNPRFQHRCRGAGVCILGCPGGRKRAGHLTMIPRAMGAGARVVTGARVRRVLMGGGRAVGVLVEPTDPGAAPFAVRGRAVVLAAGALGTPTLLQRSRLARRTGPVGANFRCHPSLKVIGLHPRLEDAWRGAHQGQQIHDFMDDGILLAHVGIPPGAVAASLHPFADDNLARMERFGGMEVSGALVDDSTTGSVRAVPFGGAIARYRIDDVQLRRLVRAVELLCRIHFEAGAEAVLLPFGGLPEVRAPDELSPLLDGRVDLRDVELVSVHGMGTCAIGSDPARHAGRPTGELWGLRGVWVADASLLPDRLGINPQLTIQALAARVADELDEALRR